MSQLALLVPITALAIPIVAITIRPITWAMNNRARLAAGYPPLPYDRRERDGDGDDARDLRLVSADNERLSGQIARLEERIAVLERIATDPAGRLEREIEALRGRREEAGQ